MEDAVKMTKVNIGVIFSICMNEMWRLSQSVSSGRMARNFVVDKVLDIKPSACLDIKLREFGA